jgi:5'-nucleotidase
MKRRDFIQKTAASSALLGLWGMSLSSFSSVDTKKITILHTNDTHSNIEPFPLNHPKFPGMGGVAKRHTLIQKIRNEEDANYHNIFYYSTGIQPILF